MPAINHKANSREPHVAVFAFPFGTHAAPLFTLARRLAIAAPNATFSFFSTVKSNSSIVPATSEVDVPENLRLFDVSDGVPEGYLFEGKPLEDIELFLKATPGNFKKGLEAAMKEMEDGHTGKKKISCLISDSFLLFAADMAEEMGVPWVSFWTAGPCSLSIHLYTDVLRCTFGVGNDAIKGQEDEPLNYIEGISPIRVRDLPEGVLFGNIDSPFSFMLHQMGQMSPRATAVSINSFEELDAAIVDDLKSKLNKCLTIGPFPLISPSPSIDPNGCLSWLDCQKAASVAYISFGTMLTPPPHELEALADGIEESGAPFLWSLQDKMRLHLPCGFLHRIMGRGVVVAWAPQSQILAHNAVGVFITHCGWNSVMESISGGVPMICRPFIGDQRLNRRLISDVWMIGMGINGGAFTKDGIVSSLELILYSDKGNEMRENIKGIKKLAEAAIGPKGRSSENFKTLLEIVSGI